MPVLVAATLPFTYNVPVVPDKVTARCVHWPVGSAAVPVSCCSPPAPLVVIANLGGVPVTPAAGVRNMYTVVFWPKSNSRVQEAVDPRLIHPAIVKLVSPAV